MRRILLAMMVLLIAVGCAKPDPIAEVRSAIERGDLEEAAAILAPFAATAAVNVVDDWEPHATVRYTHPQPERIEALPIAVKPQGYTWFTAVSSRRLDSIPDEDKTTPRTLGLRGSWEGCAEVRGEAFNGLYLSEDGEHRRVRSEESNIVTVGECLDPPPILVPEPEGGYHVLALVLCLITLAWMGNDRRRRK